MLNKMKNLMVQEEGQGLAEYGLLLAGVVVVVGAAIVLLQNEITTLFTGLLP
ncbi:Flp family type IVb pilin [Fictibacillus sp. b24]|uniref:Flp family type IVb pilin n=1 Tax=Fictibacillus sp. b24 TaxID=3055863 RepID=UPI0025A05410|nr:Flp family type IVb pilin [Fictibacillus sp. b24]MDM5314860.1 Flp family type IVb pilin [Fictibacillus sp. b24]